MTSSIRQADALTRSCFRELTWGLPGMSRELSRWKRRAAEIPDERIRADAMVTFERKVGHSAGAVIFSTLPRARNWDLLRALVAIQAAFDLLDDLHERHPTAANARLFQALVDAVTPGALPGDYYAHHPWCDDGGYLASLVTTSQECCRALPSFPRVADLLNREAVRASQVLPGNHLPEPGHRTAVLRRWVKAELPDESTWDWFELTAAASGQLTIFALLAMAAEPDVCAEEIEMTHGAYWPSVPLVATMLDSYVDQTIDAELGGHRYLSYYGGHEPLVERLCDLIDQAGRGLHALPGGHRHVVIFNCMIAFYLANERARAGGLEAGTRQLIEAGGPLTQALVPVLRIWRAAYRQRSA